MREILFRGKRKDNGEWVEGFYSQFHNRPILDEPNSHQIFELIEEGVRFLKSSIGGYWHIVDPETIGQYTGLTDKNGKKIFEGDVVKVFLKDGVEIGYIRYRNAGSRFQFIDEYSIGYNIDNTTDFEVIGNIHDNPELLKGVIPNDRKR